jgi:type 1 glutamine amidotransferase
MRRPHHPAATTAALLLTASLALAACSSAPEPTGPADQPDQAEAPAPTRDEVLIYSRTAGFRHGSIPTGIACVEELATELGLTPRATEDPAAFTDAGLADVAVVVFLSTTGDVLDEAGQAAFERYVQGGGGYLGVHAATDTEYDWPWYTGLAGGQFASHPRIQPAALVRVGEHPAVDFLPDPWQRTDEWYNFKELSSATTTLLNLDESSYEGGANGAVHPAAWYHEYDGGRAFYTAGGHTAESFGEPLFRRHLLEGLRWSAGLTPAE